MQFDKDIVDWQNALEHKLVFLANAGIEVKLPVLGSRAPVRRDLTITRPSS